MIDTKQQEINFYQNGAAEDVLKRFVFTEEEEMLVRNAIRTSKRDKPRMALIHQADELLKEVAKTRQPIEPTEITSLSPEAMVQMQMANFKQVDVKKDDRRIPFFYIPKTKLGRIIFFGMIAIIISLQLRVVEDAQEIQNEATESSQKIVEEQMKLLRGME